MPLKPECVLTCLFRIAGYKLRYHSTQLNTSYKFRIHAGSARALANMHPYYQGVLCQCFREERDLFEYNSFSTLLLNCCQQTRCTTMRYQEEQGHEREVAQT